MNLTYHMKGIEYRLPTIDEGIRGEEEAGRIRWLSQKSRDPEIQRVASQLIQKYDRFKQLLRQGNLDSEAEETMLQEQADDHEMEEFNKSMTVSWTTPGGREVEAYFEYDFPNPARWLITIDGERAKSVPAENIFPHSDPSYPDIVAKLGYIGITAEQRNALLKILRYTPEEWEKEQNQPVIIQQEDIRGKSERALNYATDLARKILEIQRPDPHLRSGYVANKVDHMASDFSIDQLKTALDAIQKGKEVIFKYK